MAVEGSRHTCCRLVVVVVVDQPFITFPLCLCPQEPTYTFVVLLVMVASLLEDGEFFRYCNSANEKSNNDITADIFIGANQLCINACHLNRWWHYPSCLSSSVILHVMCALVNHGVLCLCHQKLKHPI